MKKLLIAMASLVIMMCYIASPLFVTPVYASSPNFTGLSNTPEDILSDVWSEDTLPDKYESVSNVLAYLRDNQTITNDDYFLYYVGYYNDSYYYTVAIDFQDADCTFENNVLTLTNVTGGSFGGKGITYLTDWYKNSGSPSITRVDQFDSCILNFNTLSLKFKDGNNYSLLDLDRYDCTKIWNIKSNIPATLSASPLNVFVSFSPSLSGNVDRSINNNGVQSMRSQLYMQVVNQSSFDIQYKMAIYKKHQQTSRSFDLTVGDNVFYDSDPIFVYYADSWVYCTNCDSESTFLNSDTVKENKSCPWHYVERGDQDIVTFDFSQLNFLEGEEYTVYVYAVRNDYGFASEQIVYLASSDPAYSELKQIQGDDIATVYQSDFVMINYSDVKYDPNNSNNGVKPFNGRDGFAATQQYSYSRNARENQDGTVDYSSRNLYTNQNSWLSQQRSTALTNHSTYSNSSVPATLNNHFNGFFSFVNSVFSHLPKDIQSIYIYGFTAIVVLGIILKVVK